MDDSLTAAERVVRSLGLYKRSAAGRYLILAVALARMDETLLHHVTKGLYIDVARACGPGVTWKTVERGLRVARDAIWDTENREQLEELVGYRIRKRPSAGELVEAICFGMETRDPRRAFELPWSGLPKLDGDWLETDENETEPPKAQ